MCLATFKKLNEIRQAGMRSTGKESKLDTVISASNGLSSKEIRLWTRIGISRKDFDDFPCKCITVDNVKCRGSGKLSGLPRVLNVLAFICTNQD